MMSYARRRWRRSRILRRDVATRSTLVRTWCKPSFSDISQSIMDIIVKNPTCQDLVDNTNFPLATIFPGLHCKERLPVYKRWKGIQDIMHQGSRIKDTCIMDTCIMDTCIMDTCIKDTSIINTSINWHLRGSNGLSARMAWSQTRSRALRDPQTSSII